MKASKEEVAEAITTLRKMGVKPGAVIYTIVPEVARSGMSRHIRCYVVTRNTSTDYDAKDRPAGKTVTHGITDITWLVATACGFRQDRNNRDLIVGGCGMDMCFHVVYTLGRVMFPKGGPLAKTNGIRRHQEASKGTETDGGYLLTKRDL